MFDFIFPSFLRVPLVPLALLDPLVPLVTQARGSVLHSGTFFELQMGFTKGE